jgi:hypothetical protein
MPYLIRNAAGAVAGFCAGPVIRDGVALTEALPVADDHPDLVAFRAALAAPRTATAKQLRYALNAAGQRAAWDAALAAASADTRDYWQVEPNPPETSAKLRRLAAAAGVDLAALFDMALEY